MPRSGCTGPITQSIQGIWILINTWGPPPLKRWNMTSTPFWNTSCRASHATPTPVSARRVGVIWYVRRPRTKEATTYNKQLLRRLIPPPAGRPSRRPEGETLRRTGGCSEADLRSVPGGPVAAGGPRWSLSWTGLKDDGLVQNDDDDDDDGFYVQIGGVSIKVRWLFLHMFKFTLKCSTMGFGFCLHPPNSHRFFQSK